MVAVGLGSDVGNSATAVSAGTVGATEVRGVVIEVENEVGTNVAMGVTVGAAGVSLWHPMNAIKDTETAKVSATR